MADDVVVSVDFSWFLLLMVALGIIEAYVSGVPWYIGGVLGIVLYVLGFFGLVPVLGQVIYMSVAKWLFAEVGVGVLGWIYWLGLLESVIVSIVVVVLLVIGWW